MFSSLALVVAHESSHKYPTWNCANCHDPNMAGRRAGVNSSDCQTKWIWGGNNFTDLLSTKKNQPVNLQGCSVHCSVLQWHQEIHIKNQYIDSKHVLVNFWAWIPVSLLTKYGFCSSLQILELLSRRYNGVYYLVYLESVLATCKNIEKRKLGNYGGTVT